MADPAWTDAIRDDIATDLGFPLGLGAMARTILYWLHPQNSKHLVEHTNETAEAGFTSWAITACEPGVDTDANGAVFFQYTDGGATGELKVYRGAARDNSAGNEYVATTGSVANSATATFTPQTGYTFAGTVAHGVFGASFDFKAYIITPARLRCEQLWDNTYAFDSQVRSAFINSGGFLERMRSGARTMLTAAQDAAAYVMRNEIQPRLKGVTSPTELYQPNYTRSSFAWVDRPQGLIRDFELACEDNTGGSGAIEAQAATLAGAVAYPSGGWAGTAVTPTYSTSRGIPATITWNCVRGLTSSPPQFQAVRTPTDPRRAPGENVISETLDRPLFVGSAWKAPEWGIESLTIDYLASVTGVTNAVLSTTASDWSVTGLKSTNSNDGVVYAKYTSATTILAFYRSDQGRDDADADELVAQVTLLTTDDATTFTTDENDSGITITGKTGAGSGSLLVNGSVGDIDFQAPSATTPVSYFTATITETTAAGEWADNFRDGGIGGVSGPVNTGAGLDIVDGQILRGIPGAHAGVKGERY